MKRLLVILAPLILLLTMGTAYESIGCLPATARLHSRQCLELLTEKNSSSKASFLCYDADALWSICVQKHPNSREGMQYKLEREAFLVAKVRASEEPNSDIYISYDKNTFMEAAKTYNDVIQSPYSDNNQKTAARRGLATVNVLLGSLSPPSDARHYRSIRQVDFSNFTYELPTDSDCVQIGQSTRLTVADGRFVNQRLRDGVGQIRYGYLTDNNSFDAVVALGCGPSSGSNFTYTEVLVYTLRDGRPKLLEDLDYVKVKRDYKRYYSIPGYYGAEAAVAGIANRILIIEKLADGFHACPANRARFKYRWHGHGFVLVGKPVKTPLATQCGR
jgi:hypothetical protein